MKGESISNGPSETREPHDDHHPLGDLMGPELVAQQGQGENIEGPAYQDENQGPHHQAQLHPVREGEDAQAKIDEDRRFTDKSKGSHSLLHGDLGDGGHVVVGVVGHDHSTEQDGHDARQVDPLSQCIRSVDEAQHQGKLQARVRVQVYLLQNQGAGHGD